jgi:hypothetical protein
MFEMCNGLSEEEKAEYWALVSDELVKGGLTKPQADSLSAQYRSELESIIGDSPAKDIIYHEDPDRMAAMAMNRQKIITEEGWAAFDEASK